MTLVYGVARREPVIILGQAHGYDHLYPQHHADREESREGVKDSGSLIATARAPGHNDNRVR